jgi:hypothetical protein
MNESVFMLHATGLEPSYTLRIGDCICWIYVRHAGNYPTWRLIECGVVGCVGIYHLPMYIVKILSDLISVTSVRKALKARVCGLK